MECSFKKLIEEEYLDKISYKLNNYIYDNKEKINFKSKVINYIDQVFLVDAYFKKFYIYSYQSNYIWMNIIIETEVCIRERNRRDYIEDKCFPWFLVKCKCQFIGKISNFEIIDLEHYEGTNREENSLTDNLIPYIKKEKMDDVATKILQRYYPEALNGEAVNAYEFAKRLKLNLIEVNFNNPNIIGKIYFAECKVKNKKGEITTIPANTIKISKSSKLFGYEGSRNFTIMHECVHFLLHKKAFELECYFNKKANSLECRNNGSGGTSAKETPVDWMEWQANNIAPRLLIPKIPFINKVDKMLEQYKITHENNDCLDYYEKLIYNLANFYGVSIETIKIRLIELGYEFPLGCFINIDNKRVRPHAFNPGTLKLDETFSVSYIDAARYSIMEKYIEKNEYIDYFIYVDSHLCFNHPKYIFKGVNGIPMLTEYARRHMDECCIKFKIEIPKTITHYEPDYSTFKILSRRKLNSPAEIVIKGYKQHSKGIISKNPDILLEALEKEKELYLKMSHLPSDCFKEIKKYSGYSVSDLLDSTLSKGTIDNYLYSNQCVYSFYHVVKFLLFTNCPPKVSEHILNICNCRPNLSNEEHLWIDFVLRNRWTYSFTENIKFLREKKINL